MKAIEIDERLDTVAQEIYKARKKGTIKDIEDNPRIHEIISLNFGIYCAQHDIDYIRARELLTMIFEYYEIVEKQTINEVRIELCRVICSKSPQERFFDNLVRYGTIIYTVDTSTKDDNRPMRKRLWEMESKLYYTVQISGDLKSIKEIE